jgi:hypothetical protein
MKYLKNSILSIQLESYGIYATGVDRGGHKTQLRMSKPARHARMCSGGREREMTLTDA